MMTMPIPSPAFAPPLIPCVVVVGIADGVPDTEPIAADYPAADNVTLEVSTGAGSLTKRELEATESIAEVLDALVEISVEKVDETDEATVLAFDGAAGVESDSELGSTAVSVSFSVSTSVSCVVSFSGLGVTLGLGAAAEVTSTDRGFCGLGKSDTTGGAGELSSSDPSNVLYPPIGPSKVLGAVT